MGAETREIVNGGAPEPAVDIVPFQPWHLDWLRLQPSQLALSHTLTLSHGRSLQSAGPCYSAFAGMSVVACAGVAEWWKILQIFIFCSEAEAYDAATPE